MTVNFLGSCLAHESCDVGDHAVTVMCAGHDVVLDIDDEQRGAWRSDRVVTSSPLRVRGGT